MKTIKCISIVIFSIIAFALRGQSTTMDMLKAKEWIIQVDLGDIVGFDTYDNNQVFSTMSYKGGTPFVIKTNYYLSDVIEATFDKIKIGKTNRGKYLIFEGNKLDNTVLVFEIFKLDNQFLEIKEVKTGKIIQFKAKTTLPTNNNPINDRPDRDNEKFLP